MRESGGELWEVRRQLALGAGVLTSGDSSFVFDGEWAHDARHGEGRCVFRARGESYSGAWRGGAKRLRMSEDAGVEKAVLKPITKAPKASPQTSPTRPRARPLAMPASETCDMRTAP